MNYVIEIRQLAFHPVELTIRVGDTVKWVNRDSVRHSARRDQRPEFDTGLLNSGRESGEIEFDSESGVAGFSYYCEPHPHMTGVIVVTK